jgi:hypothetical protein
MAYAKDSVQVWKNVSKNVEAAIEFIWKKITFQDTEQIEWTEILQLDNLKNAIADVKSEFEAFDAVKDSMIDPLTDSDRTKRLKEAAEKIQKEIGKTLEEEGEKQAKKSGGPFRPTSTFRRSTTRSGWRRMAWRRKPQRKPNRGPAAAWVGPA